MPERCRHQLKVRIGLELHLHFIPMCSLMHYGDTEAERGKFQPYSYFYLIPSTGRYSVDIDVALVAISVQLYFRDYEHLKLTHHQ